VKLWVAVFFFAVGASITRLFLARAGLLGELGFALFLPELAGWGGAIWGIVALMALWYLLSSWNEQRKSVGLLKF
jgi:hypothetical protein